VPVKGRTGNEIDAVAEDMTLVERAQAGDREALGELFVRHSTTVRRLLTSVVGPSADLDDLAQDVFVQVHRSLPRFRKESRFTTWLHRITVNTAISYLRRPKGRVLPTEPQVIDAVAADSAADPHRSHVGREMVRRLYRILDSLTPKRRAAYALFEIEGRSIAEVARILGVPTTVAKSRIWFARRELKKKATGDEYLGPLIEEL
jgi:RNA polymerase sigma-70 factor (ECF subfamily)